MAKPSALLLAAGLLLLCAAGRRPKLVQGQLKEGGQRDGRTHPARRRQWAAASWEGSGLRRRVQGDVEIPVYC